MATASSSAVPRRASGARIAVVPLLAAALAALVAGTWTGLSRFGISLPGASEVATLNHGALMVGGFAGTVIAVERAIAAPSRVALLVPASSAAGAVALLAKAPEPAAPLLFALAAAGLALLFASFLRQQPGAPLLLMAAGSLCWLGANLVWLVDGWAPLRVAPWWYAFLALTIAGERLELARFRRHGPATMGLLAAAIAATMLGAVAASGGGLTGERLLGAGLLALALWLAVEDSARRTMTRGGLATYAGVALLAAYAWLGVAGAVLLRAGFTGLAASYDSALHAFFLGFVIGAIVAHAPIIFPAVAGASLRFTPLFYAALALLHASVALRIASNLAAHAEARQWAAAGNALALLLLLVAVVLGFALGRRDTAMRRRATAGAERRATRAAGVDTARGQ